MKKVLFVINTLGGAGAEKALLELLKRFPENGRLQPQSGSGLLSEF